MDKDWIKYLVAGVVISTALCGVSLFVGCTFGSANGKVCENGTDRSLSILTGLLTTCISLAVRMDVLDSAKESPKKPASRSAARQ